MKAFVFPGQGSQFVGMGKDLYDNNPLAKELFDKADEILGFKITDIMFAGTDEQLKQTNVTQPAVFLHSVISALCLGDDFKRQCACCYQCRELAERVSCHHFWLEARCFACKLHAEGLRVEPWYDGCDYRFG